MIHRVGMLVLTAAGLLAQLTPEQKLIDLQTIASLYAKQYAAYEWKRDNLGFDLFDLRPWLERARLTRTDLEYLDLVAEYIAKLQDIHSYYIANSDFVADLGLYTDIFDGKVLIERIDRTLLPASRFDFAVGDEIVQFDGKPVEEALQAIAKLSSFGNPRSTQRWAADQLVYRQQSSLPSAGALGTTATLLVRRQDGSEKSYTIAWVKSGTPLLQLGPLPNLRLSRGAIRATSGDEGPATLPEEASPEDVGVPAYRKPWLSLQSLVDRRMTKSLRGYGVREPLYVMPTGFVQRLGRLRADYFYSGTMNSGGKRIGLIRIGTFEPNAFGLVAAAYNQFAQEIGFMKANTDVLVVDIMQNPGGFACYGELLQTLLINKPFQSVGVEIRPNLDLIRNWEFYLQDAQDFGEEWEVRLYNSLLKDIKTAYSENRGRTGTIPFCGPTLDMTPARDGTGAVLAYDKPILLLTDDFSVSAADAFAAVLQDAGVAKLFGSRTAGAGGNTVNAAAGFFSEGAVSLSQMLMVRPKMQSVPGFPASRYVENIGVGPDIAYDFQTRDNLLRNGAPFVDAFLKAAAALVQ